MALEYLLFMRHAKSSWAQDITDHERPLNTRGQQAVKAVGGVIQAKGLVPNAIWSSDSTRTRETVALLFQKDDAPGAEFLSQLYHASANKILCVCAERGEPQSGPLLLVGHNPGYADLFAYFAQTSRHFPTGACVVLKRVDMQADWLSPQAWQFTDFICPRDVLAGQMGL